MSDDPRLFSPAAVRNRGPILEVLRHHLPAAGKVLEVASGTGEHVTHFAEALPNLVWQPTDRTADSFASIDAWANGRTNVLPACMLDAQAEAWPVRQAAAVLCINMIHIAPWPAAVGLVSGAARILPPGGLLALYGPFRRGGQDLEPGNVAFDADLQSRNTAWGLREVETVSALAADAGFGGPDVVEMPADNLMLLFRLASAL